MLLRLCLMMVGTVLASSCSSDDRGPLKVPEVLLFEDTFSELDMTTWTHESTMGGGGNWEFQMYGNRRANSFVENGTLFIKPSLTRDRLGEKTIRGQHSRWESNRIDLWGTCTDNANWGCERMAHKNENRILPPIESAKLTTADAFSFKYGRVEVVAKLPRGDWLWPAAWMMPKHNTYGEWPTSGEIDIMEARGNAPHYKRQNNESLGYDTYGAACHWGAQHESAYKLTHRTHTSTNATTLVNAFHTYGLYWDDTRLYTYFDDPSNIVMEIHDYVSTSFWQKGVDNLLWKNDTTVSQRHNPWRAGTNHAPFDQEFYLILNLAVGGTAGNGNGYFPDDDVIKPWKNVNGKTPASTAFYDAIDDWFPTWGDPLTAEVLDTAALKIDSVRVWGFPGITTVNALAI